MKNDERRVICSWCRCTIKEGVEPVSHGICPKCADDILEEVEGGGSNEQEDPGGSNGVTTLLHLPSTRS